MNAGIALPLSSINDGKKAIRAWKKNRGLITTTLGDLKFEDEIGEGGNAIVYRGSWGNSQVAIKILAEDCSTERTSKKLLRFLDEVRALILLDRPESIVSYHYFDYLLINNWSFPYAIMPLFPDTLKSWVFKFPIRNMNDLNPILNQLLDKLEIIHSAGIVHRDIKPENIFVRDGGKVVLGDFGIAWFDPQHYNRLAKTSNNDRLANYHFSAPEQSEKNRKPHPSMDLYALGQIVQWMISGRTHRGTGRTQLRTFDSSFEILDLWVEQLLQDNYRFRPQSVDEARAAFQSITERNDQEMDQGHWGNLEEFDNRLSEAAPGIIGLLKISDQSHIDNLLAVLSQDRMNFGLWWKHDRGEIPISRLVKVDQNFWLINKIECKIDNVWMYRDRFNFNKQFILLQSAPMPRFDFDEDGAAAAQKAGFFQGVYFPYEEFIDRFARIGGEIKQLDGTAEERIRYHTLQYYFLVVRGSDIFYQPNEAAVNNIHHRITELGDIDLNILEDLKQLKRDDQLIS